MPVSKIYNALQTGVLDGVYISPGALYRPWRLAEPGEHVTAGMNGPTSLFFIAMNKKVWNGLSAEHKAAVNKHTGKRVQHDGGQLLGQDRLRSAEYRQDRAERRQVPPAFRAEAAAAFDAATAKSVDAYLADKEKKGDSGPGDLQGRHRVGPAPRPGDRKRGERPGRGPLRSISSTAWSAPSPSMPAALAVIGLALLIVVAVVCRYVFNSRRSSGPTTSTRSCWCSRLRFAVGYSGRSGGQVTVEILGIVTGPRRLPAGPISPSRRGAAR